MSTARLLEEEQPSPVPYARVKRQANGVYNKLYLGKQRAPQFADEAGAFCVIELVCAEGERLCIYPIPGDRVWVRVASLPASAR